tara:strand:+ start:3156 stop:3374 length:219 start_codon:yes stop_codon:yes gene_type:complete
MKILSPIKISIILAFWAVIFFVMMPRAASIKECQSDDAPRFSANGASSYNELTKILNISRQRLTYMVKILEK